MDRCALICIHLWDNKKHHGGANNQKSWRQDKKLITFPGSKTREQPRAPNYQLTLGRGLKALSSPFWQETLRWCAKWVKAHPKSHNHSGLPLLLPASPSVCQYQPRGAISSPTEDLGEVEVEGVICSWKTCIKMWTSSGHKCASKTCGGYWLSLCFTRVCCSSSHTYCNVWSSVSTALRFSCFEDISFPS